MRNDSLVPLVLLIGVVVVLAGFLLWRCDAPCSSLGWMPIKELPARCLKELSQ